MSSASEFEISKTGILKKYNGPGGDVVIPDGVKVIGEKVFNYSIKSLTIPPSVTEIRENYYNNRYGRRIEAVKIYDLAAWCKIKYAQPACNPLFHAHHLYLNGERVTDLVIPEGVTEIGAYAFAGGCFNSVTVPGSVTHVGAKPFESGEAEDGSTRFTIPETVANLPESFHIVDGVLKSYTGVGGDVTVPDGVTSIGSQAFMDCRSLTSVKIPDSVTEIGKWAFTRCEALADVIIPKSVESVGEGAFLGCRKLSVPNGLVILKGTLLAYCGEGESVSIPDGVKRIGGYAFSGCKSLVNVTIPGSVKSIGSHAFSGCSNLIHVTIPSGVTSIEERAFTNCIKLQRLDIPDTVGQLGEGLVTEHYHTRISIPDIALLPVDMRRKAIECFMEDGWAKDDPRYASHNKHMKANAVKLIDEAMKSKDLLALLCRESLITPKNAELYMDAAQKSGDAELIAMMLDYQNSRIGSKEKEALEKRKEKAQDTVMERLVSRMGKDGINGLNIAVTGKLETFDNRDKFKAFLAQQGARLASGLTAKVDYLIMNDPEADSAKAKKAQELGIEIITERRFNELAGSAAEQYAKENNIPFVTKK